jgi:hypothetical protein
MEQWRPKLWSRGLELIVVGEVLATDCNGPMSMRPVYLGEQRDLKGIPSLATPQ